MTAVAAALLEVAWFASADARFMHAFAFIHVPTEVTAAFRVSLSALMRVKDAFTAPPEAAHAPSSTALGFA